MPPHAHSDHSYDDQLLSFESIEIEAGHDRHGKFIVSNIVCHDHDDSSPQENPLHLTRGQLRDADEELRETKESIYETLASSLLLACSGECHTPTPKPRKSALKQATGLRKCPSISQRNVSFKTLEIREYKMTLGDHPSAHTGPPVTLGWEHQSLPTVDLESYEQAREPRRSRRKLKLSLKRRQELLQAKGFTIQDIQTAWDDALRIRKQRYETVMQGLVSMKLEEAWQSANRKFWRLFNYES